ncbi:hypothetical protein LCGC14_0288950 [marine sediment metagenome]|uniref:KOW domain-containing protein n=1 Tax=marine sediment metagenome TaxID=412755 RepID=A0A0F9WZD5_9ZZZZ
MARVLVKGSPYRAVKVGAIGKVINHERINTTLELVVVEFKDGTHWRFYRDEIEFLEEEQ